MIEYFGLVSQDLLEKSPMIKKLKKTFKEMLPSWFDEPYFIPAPPNTTLQSVIRANCRNKGCSVRAIVHIVRDDQGICRIKESQPIFDRVQNPCDSCQNFLDSQLLNENCC